MAGVLLDSLSEIPAELGGTVVSVSSEFLVEGCHFDQASKISARSHRDFNMGNLNVKLI